MRHELTGVTRRLGPVVLALVAAACGGEKAVAAPDVVVRVAVIPDSVTLESLGASQSLHAAAYSAEGQTLLEVPFEWVSTDPSVASLASAGGGDAMRSAMAVAEGVTRIVVSSEGVQGSAMVVVRQKVASIDLSPASAVLDVLGAQATFSAVLADATGHPVDHQTVTWSSSDPSVAVVDDQGSATAVGQGETSIVASADGRTATAALTVDQAVMDVRIAPDSVVLNALGETAALQPTVLDGGGSEVAGTVVSWRSSDTGVATVDDAGVVTATGNGRARIIARAEAVEDSVDVVVRQRVARIVVQPEMLQFDALHRTVTVSPAAFDQGGNPVANVSYDWRSSNPGVAAVSDAGEVTSLDNGTATISVEADDAEAIVSVSVAQVVDRLSLTPASVTLASLGETAQVVAVALDPGGTPVSVATPSWASSDPSVVDVGAGGIVRAIRNGQATVTATAAGVSDHVGVLVQQQVARIAVTPNVNPLIPGNSLPLQARLIDALGSDVAGVSCTWSAADPTVATTTASGVVTAHAMGTTAVLCARGGVAGSATVNVVSAAWPNVPAGYTTFSDQPWDALASNGWQHHNREAMSHIVSDPTAPMSPTNVLEQFYPAGYPGFGTEPAVDWIQMGGRTAVYLGAWFKASPNWQGHPSNINKIFFFFDPVGDKEIVFSMYGPTGGPYQLRPVAMSFPDPRGTYLPQNVHTMELVPGQWHRIEIQLINGQGDGVIRWWQDGVLLGQYTDFVYPTGGFGEVQIAPTWGGVGAVTKQHADYFRFDQILVVGR